MNRIDIPKVRTLPIVVTLILVFLISISLYVLGGDMFILYVLIVVPLTIIYTFYTDKMHEYTNSAGLYTGNLEEYLEPFYKIYNGLFMRMLALHTLALGSIVYFGLALYVVAGRLSVINWIVTIAMAIFYGLNVYTSYTRSHNCKKHLDNIAEVSAYYEKWSGYYGVEGGAWKTLEQELERCVLHVSYVKDMYLDPGYLSSQEKNLMLIEVKLRFLVARNKFGVTEDYSNE